MKKIYFLLFSLVAGNSAFAQTFPNAGMETWRSGTSGTSPAVTVHAPAQWFGSDSLLISAEETLLPLFEMYSPTDLHAQVFQETGIFHSGASSAKLITLKQDTLGFFPGVLSNAAPNLNIGAITSGDYAHAVNFSGGTAITGRIASVTAWVQYKAGKDSTGATGIDSGSLTVTVYSHIVATGFDSAVGTAILQIPPSTSWTQITANVVYNDSLDGADTVRVQFASSGANTLDSSTLYVDDVSMTYLPNSVKNVNLQNEIKVYPNPASGAIYFDVAQNTGLSCSLYSVSGQVVVTKALNGKDAIDISGLSDGMYFYAISDSSGSIVQRGKVSVIK